MNFINAAPHGFAHGIFDLCEGLLDRIEVRTVGRQEEESGADGTDRGPDRFALVAAEVVDHDDVAWTQGLGELGLDVGLEGLGINGAVDDPRRFDSVVTQRCQERHGSPMTIRRISDQACAERSPAAQGRHVGLDPGFVDKDEPAAVNPALILSPLLSAARDLWPFLLGRHQRFF